MSSGYGESSNSSLVLGHEDESSHGGSDEHQLALDEALARALELGDDFNNLYVHEHGVRTVGNNTFTLQDPSILDLILQNVFL